VPAINLARMLVPDSQLQVPATRQTAALIGLLPVPDLVPDAAEAAATAHIPTRLAPSQEPADDAILRPPVLR
jgi:hypothetical protein